jgi:hypothetical protein
VGAQISTIDALCVGGLPSCTRFSYIFFPFTIIEMAIVKAGKAKRPRLFADPTHEICRDEALFEPLNLHDAISTSIFP